MNILSIEYRRNDTLIANTWYYICWITIDILNRKLIYLGNLHGIGMHKTTEKYARVRLIAASGSNSNMNNICRS